MGTAPPRNLPKNVIIVNRRPMDLGLNSMFDRVDWPFLTRTVVIEAGVIAIVVFTGGLRRRARRTWRAYARRYGERAREGADTGGRRLRGLRAALPVLPPRPGRHRR